jgi:hypothetical protein
LLRTFSPDGWLSDGNSHDTTIVGVVSGDVRRAVAIQAMLVTPPEVQEPIGQRCWRSCGEWAAAILVRGTFFLARLGQSLMTVGQMVSYS